jgi:hypothetical protein
LETISSVKGEEREASADCKLGEFKHKIFKWQHRILKKNTSCWKENYSLKNYPNLSEKYCPKYVDNLQAPDIDT